MYDTMADFPEDGALKTTLRAAHRAVEQIMVHSSVLQNEHVESLPAGVDMVERFCWCVVEAASNEIRGTVEWRRRMRYNLPPWNVMMNGLAKLVHIVEDRATHTFTPSSYDWVSLPSPGLSTRYTMPTEGYFLTAPVVQHETFRVIAGLLYATDMLEDVLFPVYAQYYDMLQTLCNEDMTAYSDTSIYRDMRALISTHVVGSFDTTLHALDYDEQVPFAWQAPQFCEQYRVIVQGEGFQQMFDELLAGHQRRDEMLRNGGRVIVLNGTKS